jgi:hypothetical protein
MGMEPNRNLLGRNPLSDAPYRNLGVVLSEQRLGSHHLSVSLHLRLDVVISEQGVNSIELPLLCSNVPNDTTLRLENQIYHFSASFLQFEQITDL